MNSPRFPRKPVIGITGRPLHASEIFPSDAELMQGLLIDGYFRAYTERVVAAGGIPVNLAVGVATSDIVPILDGVILVGGMDVDPRLYGQERSEKVGRFDTGQDRFDIQVTTLALEHGLPVLGCCRGSQIINVALGGTLVEDLPSAGVAGHNIREFPPSAPRHAVGLTAGSRIHTIYGDSIEVNSFHHQAIDRVGTGLTVTARAEDGTIEAVEHVELPVIGVQWHPELHEGVEPVFDWLIDSAMESRGTRQDQTAAPASREG
jgi:putative glutamine amidotransferase